MMEDEDVEFELWRDGVYIGSFDYLGDNEDHESLQEAALRCLNGPDSA